MAPTNPHTLERQVLPLRAGLDEIDANARLWNIQNAQRDAQDTVPVPRAAEASTDVGADELQSPTRWLHRMAGAFMLGLAIVACLALIVFAAFLPRHQ